MSTPGHPGCGLGGCGLGADVPFSFSRPIFTSRAENEPELVLGSANDEVFRRVGHEKAGRRAPSGQALAPARPVQRPLVAPALVCVFARA